MDLRAEQGSLAESRAELTALCVFADRADLDLLLQDLEHMMGAVPPSLTNGAFTGQPDQILSFVPHHASIRHLVIVGLGNRESFHPERLRRAAAAIMSAARAGRARTIDLVDPVVPKDSPHGLAPAEIGQALGEGLLLGAYSYQRYVTDASKKTVSPRRAAILCTDRRKIHLLAEGLNRASAIGGAVVLARDLANAPGNDLYPETLASEARKAGRRHGFRVTVHNERSIARMKMGGVIGVSQGSARPPRFIIMEYGGRHNAGISSRREKPLVLVGKGITFDAGGISLKPPAGMEEQKLDMAGAAAVIGTMQAAASLRLPVTLVGLIPAAENLPSGTALKPGDVIRQYNGMTTEIENTDAEGRLILADAISYAARYRPSLVIDVATLTGACMVALGRAASGMMGSDQAAMDRLHASGERTGERVWQLPMYEEYGKALKSEVADIKNRGGRWAGAITAAMFLKRHAGTTPWIHLDIAGTALAEEQEGYLAKGATGVGVRLLTDFLIHREPITGREPSP